MPKTRLPSNWPREVSFLTRPLLSKKLPRSTLDALGLSQKQQSAPPSLSSSMLLSSRRSLVQIRRIDDPAHPANTQFGLFAAATLPARAFIVDYLGFVHGSSDSDPDSDYDLWMDRELDVAIDATRAGNEARMVNDYRGVPGFTGPNVEFNMRRIQGSGEARMGLFVGSKDVRKGTELCVSYGKGFWRARDEIGGGGGKSSETGPME